MTIKNLTQNTVRNIRESFSLKKLLSDLLLIVPISLLINLIFHKEKSPEIREENGYWIKAEISPTLGVNLDSSLTYELKQIKCYECVFIEGIQILDKSSVDGNSESFWIKIKQPLSLEPSKFLNLLNNKKFQLNIGRLTHFAVTTITKKENVKNLKFQYIDY